MTARQHPLILTGTCLWISKLKDAGPTVAVRIKMCGTKEELVTTMVNPFHAQQGGSFNLGKALKKTGKAVAKGAKAAAPYVSAGLEDCIGGNTERTLTAAAGPSTSDPYRHALTMRPPRKVRPFSFFNYYF